jgi:hypothetical protein
MRNPQSKARAASRVAAADIDPDDGPMGDITPSDVAKDGGPNTAQTLALFDAIADMTDE